MIKEQKGWKHTTVKIMGQITSVEKILQQISGPQKADAGVITNAAGQKKPKYRVCKKEDIAKDRGSRPWQKQQGAELRTGNYL